MTKQQMGRWSEEEHQRYLVGVKKFGTKFDLLEAFIQTRNITQIRTHHRTHALKMEGGDSRKRKADKGEDGTGKKKVKADSKAVTPKKASQGAVGVAATSQTPKVKTPGRGRKKTPKTTGESVTMKPPSDLATSSKKGAKASSKASKAPKKIDPVAQPASTILMEESPEIGIGKPSFLAREDVQTVIAGVVGFAIVYLVKQIFG